MRIDRFRLVLELERRGMTQKKLAEITGVSRTTINYIKNGKSCSYEVCEKIANALEMPLDELVNE